MINKIRHYTDNILTEQVARKQLIGDKIVIAWYTNRSNCQCVVHSHPYYEAILPISGKALYSYNGILQMVAHGELILFPSDIYHSVKYDVSNEISERLIIQIDGDFWKSIAEELKLNNEPWNKDVIILNSNDVAAWDIRGLLVRMNLSSSLMEASKYISYKCQLTELMMIIHQIVSENHVVKSAANNVLVSKTVEYIQANYTNPSLTVNSIAEYMFVSREHLSRLFKEYTMESIHSYLTNLRMQYFCNAIADGKSILETCIESGFSDYSSFLKTFRKLYGITPLEYRTNINS